MRTSEADTPSKSPKKLTPQEQTPATSASPATLVYPDWSNYQAYSPMPPHPYMWGAQPMIPPYGTPPPYVMYPPYAHPSIPPGSHPYSPYATMPSPNGNSDVLVKLYVYILPYQNQYKPCHTSWYVLVLTLTGLVPVYGFAILGYCTFEIPISNICTSMNRPVRYGNLFHDTCQRAASGGQETEGKSSNGREKIPIKRSKGSLGNLNTITGKSNTEPAKALGSSANGAVSQSGESGSDSSTEGSDYNSQNDDPHQKGSGSEEPFGDKNGMTRTPSQAKLAMALPAGPTTNLNIGMDYWAPPSSAAVRAKVPSSGTVSGAVVPSEQWIPDERELKRQRRKQSNRESARRSRLRKQAECEELAHRAEALKQENEALRGEVERIRKEYQNLLSHNSSLKEKLGEKDSKTDELELGKKDEKKTDEKKPQPEKP